VGIAAKRTLDPDPFALSVVARATETKASRVLPYKIASTMRIWSFDSGCCASDAQDEQGRFPLSLTEQAAKHLTVDQALA